MSLEIPLLFFWLKKLLAAMVLPPFGPILLVAMGLLLLRRHARIGTGLAWIGVCVSVLLSASPSVRWFAEQIEPDLAVTPQALADAQAIVILGGGKRRHAPEYGGESVNRLTLERLRYGARLASETGLPILVTGGAAEDETPEADLMQAALEIDFHRPVRWIERASRDTRQNAQYSAVHLKAAGISTIALVTHAIHMPRARAEFEAQGFTVVEAPTGWISSTEPGELNLGVLPNASAAYGGWMASHEWLGRLVYRISRD